MRKNFGSKPWIYPMPVLMVATYDENGTPDVMNAAWGGIYENDRIVLSLSPSHKTTQNIHRNGAFTVSFATADTMIPCDYAGIASANKDPDKFEKTGFHTEKSEFVNAPLIAELPMALECRLVKFNEDGICIGEIVNTSAQESVLNDEGMIDAQKLKPLCFDPVSLAYRTLGDEVGQAFSVGKQLDE